MLTTPLVLFPSVVVTLRSPRRPITPMSITPREDPQRGSWPAAGGVYLCRLASGVAGGEVLLRGWVLPGWGVSLPGASSRWLMRNLYRG
jgi:hypothetical protein